MNPGENQTIEWKESWRDEYIRWICGFANTQGGRLIIGKNDKGAVLGGQKNTHKYLQKRQQSGFKFFTSRWNKEGRI